MFSAITDSFNTSNVSNVASLPKFPSEEPSKKDLDDWLDVAGAVLTRAGYGSAMRTFIFLILRIWRLLRLLRMLR